MPASPAVISANVSNVKVDGDVVPGLQEINLKVSSGKVNGILKIRGNYKKFEHVIISGNESQTSFQIVVEIKKLGETTYTFGYNHCYLSSFDFLMNADGQAISQYSFTGSILKNPKPNIHSSSIGTSIKRPQRIVR